MTQANAIRSLIEKVEAGDIHDTGADRFDALNSGAGVYVDHGACRARDAYWGDETTAFALMREVLGDRWGLEIIENSGAWSVYICTCTETCRADHKSLPVAILLATLKAKLFELENEDG